MGALARYCAGATENPFPSEFSSQAFKLYQAPTSRFFKKTHKKQPDESIEDLFSILREVFSIFLSLLRED